MQAIFNYIIIGFLWLVSLLPLRVLYIFSDLFCHIIRLIGYRRAVINENLRYSFPDKSAEEIRSIRLKFYSHLCDLFFETIKIQNMSEKEMRRRVKLNNFEYVHQCYDNGKDIIGVTAHYGNWEWFPSMKLHIKATGVNVYRPLKNKHFDKYMLRLRSKWGTVNFDMRSTFKEVIKLKRKNERFFIGLVADQSPGLPEIQYWTQFLNQNTAVLTGPEKMAKLTKSPVVYVNMRKIKRGYYEIDIIPLMEDSASSAEHEITDLYIKHLESVITDKPEFWLWSHKRWKYSKQRVLKTDANN